MQDVLPKDKTFTVDDKISNKVNENINVSENIENKKKSLNLDDYYDSRDKTEFLSNLSTENQKKLIAFSSYALKSLELTLKEDSELVRSLAPLRGEIWCFDFGLNVGSEMDKIRPCIIVSYKEFNVNSGLVTVIPITTSMSEVIRDTNFIINKDCVDGDDVSVYGVAKAEGITTKSKSRLGKKIGNLNNKGLNLLNRALCAHLGLSVDFTDQEISFDKIEKTNIVKDSKKEYEPVMENEVVIGSVEDKNTETIKYPVKNKYSTFNNTKKSRVTKKNKKHK